MSSSDRLPDQLTDKLTIETPEQTPLEFPLAGIGSRFLALAFDTLIQFAAISLLGIVWLLLASSIGKSWQAGGIWAMAIVGFLVFSLYFGYFGVFEDRKSTRLNSSHLGISYAVFCLKKKTKSS